jgi:hypothetical protein
VCKFALVHCAKNNIQLPVDWCGPQYKQFMVNTDKDKRQQENGSGRMSQVRNIQFVRLASQSVLLLISVKPSGHGNTGLLSAGL